ELVFQRCICRTAVPTGEVHRLPQKVRVFIGVVVRSQGRPLQNPAKSQYARALPRYTSRNLKMEMDIRSSYCKHFCRERPAEDYRVAAPGPVGDIRPNDDRIVKDCDFLGVKTKQVARS